MRKWTSDEYLAIPSGVFEIRGAAGAGKTYQLTEDIRTIVRKHKHVAVISFSNAAVNELNARLGKTPVTLRTIHSFCWMIVGSISRRLLDIIELTSDFEPEALIKSEHSLADVKKVSYGELGIPHFVAENGQLWLSHDDVISLFIEALSSVSNFTKLISSAFDYILIDEYQDTNGLFLNALIQNLASSLIIGLYGDPFQSIYLDKNSFQPNLETETLHIQTYFLPKNHRSQASLVEFFNKSRESYDKLVQESTYDTGAYPQVFTHRGQLTPELVERINSSMNFKRSVTLSLTNGVRTTAAGFGEVARMIRNWVLHSTNHIVDWPEILRTVELSPYVRAIIEYGKLLFGSDYSSVQALFKVFTAESIWSVGMNSIRMLINDQLQKKSINTDAYVKLGLEFSKEIREIRNRFDVITFDELRQIDDFYDSLNTINRQSMTIFAAKGLEFNDVILNIDYGRYPNRNWNQIRFNHNEGDTRDIDSDIMLYLFYVGVTRAKRGLAIYVNTQEHQRFLRAFEKKFTDYLSRQPIIPI